jgi:hypothetical protein
MPLNLVLRISSKNTVVRVRRATGVKAETEARSDSWTFT